MGSLVGSFFGSVVGSGVDVAGEKEKNGSWFEKTSKRYDRLSKINFHVKVILFSVE